MILTIIAPIQSGWKALDGTDYKLKYPETWELNTSGLQGTKFILFAHIEGAPFRDNINLIVQDLPDEDFTLQKYVEISEGQVKQFITGSDIIFSETSNSRHKMIYTGSLGQLKLKWQQYLWVKNNKAYVLTFTAAQDSYDKKVDMATEIMDSFVLK